MAGLVEATVEGGVGLVRIDRPEARNALSPEVMQELADAVERFDAAEETTMSAGLEQERRLYELAMATEDRVEGMRAFLEKRQPEFKGK